MNVFTDEEKRGLAALHARASAVGAPGEGREIADHMRLMLPDLDDVTIGRVLLRIAIHLGALHQVFGEEAAGQIGRQYMMAALQLTALEWQETHRA
jgi:hypothetical protein